MIPEVCIIRCTALAFYRDVLGCEEGYTLKRDDGTDWITAVRVNEVQFVELIAGRPRSGGPLGHFAIYTNDLNLVRKKLIAHGVQPLNEIHTGRTGSDFFSVKDPDGHEIEIVRYLGSAAPR